MRTPLLNPIQIRWVATIVLLASVAGCVRSPEPGSEQHVGRITGAIDDERLKNADRYPGDWITHGLNYGETRYSQLEEINTANIERLGLAWSFDLGTRRGIEATPLVVDGIMFATGPWSVVYAFDARKGTLIWRFDPEVPGSYGEKVCCDVVNRGVALYEGKVFVGSLDGRLIALDSATGDPIWEVVTVDQSKMYTITGAPRIVDGKVIIGNGGADFGVRGYVSAYDADTGKLEWRTYTVPGDPSEGFESEAMEKAAETWTGEWWKAGGGGTAWDAMAYDPALDLLYVGTGNGSPWNREHRSPGGGDNLYLASILALNPSDGDLVWHFQTTPGETWDYTATQHMILADLEIEGTVRKVLMQAPKNGFFYVLDRETGEFISAAPYVEVGWAVGVDPETGRPIQRPGSDFWTEDYTAPPGSDGRQSWTDTGYLNTPGPDGGHNWHPMAFSPQTGLVYVPAQNTRQHYYAMDSWHFEEGLPNTGISIGPYFERPTGELLAWDPVSQEEVWRVSYENQWNGGVLATAGGLVFQGTADGRFVAYDATNGDKLWERPVGTGVIAPPITYVVDGRQYVTLMAGWGGAFGMHGGPFAAKAGVRSIGRVFTFALDADTPLPDFEREELPLTGPRVGLSATADEVQKGRVLYHIHCSGCHGEAVISGGVTPDLRYASVGVHSVFDRILLEGLFESRGMPSFAGRLSTSEVEMIRAYVISQSIAAAEANRQE